MKNTKEIMEIKDYLVGYYSELHTQFNLLSEFYNQKIPLGVVKEVSVLYNPPTARIQIDTATDHLMGLGQNVHVYLWSESQKAKDLVGTYERFGQMFLNHIDRIYRVNVRRNCIKNCFLFGMFALKGPLYVPRLKPEGDEEEYREQLNRTFPFRFRAVHPMNILLDPSDPPQYVIEVYGRTVASIRKAWPKWTNPKNLEDKRIVRWLEFWDANQRQYFIDEEPLLDEEDQINVYGFVPYKIGYSGLGLDSPEGKPEELAVSIIAPALSAYKVEGRIKTAIADNLERGLLQQPTITKKPEDDFKLAKVPGDISIIDPDYGFHNRDVPQVSKDAYTMLGIIDQDEQAVIPHILEGRWPKGMTAGYPGAISIGQARIKLGGTGAAWETAISAALDDVLFLIKNVVKEPVGLMGFSKGTTETVTLKPEEIKPALHHFDVKLDVETPEQKDRRIMLGQRLDALRQQSGGLAGLSWETICRDYYGYDPALERERMLVESALKNPLIQQALAISAMQDADMQEALQLLRDGRLLASPESAPQQGEFEGVTRKKMRLGPGVDELGSEEEMEGAE